MPHLPKAKKSYGQNFLVDRSVLKKIIAAAELEPGETVLEIGPGTGILTEALLNAGVKVVAVEADPELAALMREKFGDRIQLIEGDILNVILSEAKNPPRDPSSRKAGLRMTDGGYKLISNIPYNITSSILEKFLTESPRPTRLVLMVQREVVDRIVAKPPDMSVLSVMCQLYAECKKIGGVSAGAFRPVPKVDSAIIRLDLRQPPVVPLGKGDTQRVPPLFQPKADQPLADKGRLGGVTGAAIDPEAVIALAKAGFASRRKQLHGNLARAGFGTSEKIKQILLGIGLRTDIRAENLSVENWIALFSVIARR